LRRPRAAYARRAKLKVAENRDWLQTDRSAEIAGAARWKFSNAAALV
jgi:hypothetical protein